MMPARLSRIGCSASTQEQSPSPTRERSTIGCSLSVRRLAGGWCCTTSIGGARTRIAASRISRPCWESLKQLDRYTEAELMAAVITAAYTIFVKSSSGGRWLAESVPRWGFRARCPHGGP